jgi:hypothetical protein
MAESTLAIEGTESPASAENDTAALAAPAGILARISVGALLQFQCAALPSYYAMAASLLGHSMVLAGERGSWGNPNFVVTMYDYNAPQNSAKISLRSAVAPVGYWAAGKSVEGFHCPLVIDAKQAGHFLLTDTGRGISIQNSFYPPQPFVHLVPPGVASYLGYDFADTGGNRGLFNISIVG